jgi:mannose-6-phosphate isomerase-like protein (cupin superfamily)
MRTDRPWGWHEVIDEGNRYKIKQIQVNPGCSLDLQMHYHRSEHWVVVSGTAKVIIEDKEFLLSESESTYIPCACKHKLSNPGVIPLRIVEVQSGTYLKEDDMITFNKDGS